MTENSDSPVTPAPVGEVPELRLSGAEIDAIIEATKDKAIGRARFIRSMAVEIKTLRGDRRPPPSSTSGEAVDAQWIPVDYTEAHPLGKRFSASALAAAEARGVAIGLERAALSAGAHDVLAERERQVSVEGWAPAHDDEHWNGGLAWAASCYCVAQWANVSPPVATFIKHAWPWDKKWWKPTDRRRNLVKAGALIIAELDRLDRADALRSLSPAHKGSENV